MSTSEDSKALDFKAKQAERMKKLRELHTKRVRLIFFYFDFLGLKTLMLKIFFIFYFFRAKQGN